MRPLLEVISVSPQDSKIIAGHGADRIQLVSALEIGGLTPSRALLRKSLEVSDIPTMVMVRHHNQGFVLEPWEKDLLVQEAVDIVDAGGKGLVVGAILADNNVDEEFLAKLRKQISNKIDITFHKASDQTNILQTYDKLKTYEIGRVLTQGGKGSIQQNGSVINELLKIKEVKTLLGGGININNVQKIIKEFHPNEIHIGTCVRKDKYGPVEGCKVEEFINKMNYE